MNFAYHRNTKIATPGNSKGLVNGAHYCIDAFCGHP